MNLECVMIITSWGADVFGCFTSSQVKYYRPIISIAHLIKSEVINVVIFQKEFDVDPRIGHFHSSEWKRG